MAAAIAVVNQYRANATPTPKAGPYDSGWTGQFCCYIYSAECLLEMPGVPTFEKGQNNGG